MSISIETRPEVGAGFDPIACLFKQFEWIVVGEERALVALRTNHRHETVYLYRLNTSPADARRLLGIYLARINELAERPEFLSSVDQQLHHQNHPLCKCRRSERPV